MDDETKRYIDRLFDRQARKMRNIVGRGIVVMVDDGKKMQENQIKLLDGELIAGAERAQQYGFSSHPHSEAECFVVFAGACREHPLVFSVDDRRYRLKNIRPGEVALYTDEGDYIHFQRDNTIKLKTKHFVAATDEDALVTTADGDAISLTRATNTIGMTTKHVAVEADEDVGIQTTHFVVKAGEDVLITTENGDAISLTRATSTIGMTTKHVAIEAGEDIGIQTKHFIVKADEDAKITTKDGDAISLTRAGNTIGVQTKHFAVTVDEDAKIATKDGSAISLTRGKPVAINTQRFAIEVGQDAKIATKDGAAITIKSGGAVEVKAKHIVFQADESMSLETKAITIKADSLSIIDKVSDKAVVSVDVAQGNLTVTNDVLANAGAVSLRHHVHSGVQAGAANSNKPVGWDTQT